MVSEFLCLFLFFRFAKLLCISCYHILILYSSTDSYCKVYETTNGLRRLSLK